MSQIKIHEVVSQTMEAMRRMGLCEYTVWNEHRHTFRPVIKLHEYDEKEFFDREIITEYMRSLETRYENGEISIHTYRGHKRGVQRLTVFHDTGRLEWSAPKKVSRFILNEYYENIMARLVSGDDLSSKGKSDITWVGRKYFSWLIEEGHDDLSRSGANEVQGFMIYCSRHMVGNSLHNLKLYMKKLYRFLADNGYANDDYSGLFAFSVSRVSRLYAPASHEEINQTLEMIDRRTPQGKRDYAIILLGTVTGLRAIDIARMKLTDIDWRKGELKFVQSKTGNSAALPLTHDVGSAIKEYILKVRPKTEYDNVFLCVRNPVKPFSNGVAIGDIYDYYRKRAGLPRDAYDGKGFHSLRRSLGKNLITSGATVEMTAQILGDVDIKSVQKYISLDSEHLKECALDFTGIMPKRGVMSL
jgi:site-specific recombinase XerD